MLIPRDYQTEAVRSLWQYFRDHTTGNPVIALPTGTGKAGVIAFFLDEVFRVAPRQKILVATHVKELVKQNYDEFMGVWPTAPAGIYSAGLRRKDVYSNITFCGIASICKNIEKFGHIDLMIIDECHLLSQDDESMYLKTIAALQKVNPYLRIIGLTATPWRAGQGRIIDDGIFTDLCFDLTNLHAFNRFIKEGYLVPLIPKSTNVILDVSGVKIRGGEFVEKELQLASSNDEITYAAIQEAVEAGKDRHHWLVFAAGVENTVKITQMLNYLGVSARCVHSNTKTHKMSEKERDQNIEDWKAGKFTAMVNNGILTTGVNFKAIDMIVMLRATASTVLWVQMLGRGTRPLYAPGYDLTTIEGRLAAIAQSEKQNCLVMDFAQNTKRLGPINDPVLPRKRGEKTGEVPIKICEACGMYNHLSVKFCGGEPFATPAGCGAEFSIRVKIQAEASTEELIKEAEEPIVATFKVDHITYDLHRKIGKPPSIKVTYYCGNRKFNEYVLVEHEGFGRRKAVKWWRERTGQDLPATTQEALTQLNRVQGATDIKVWVNASPLPQIMEHSFTGAFAKPIVGDEIPF